ncbi:hypothetical protein K469DRAFT_752972 [Zopfia rhizophila CBS 207.26]|uniref:Uncharacterized protein n=1 Tax=Zopfia rhizophila CBS 207.26 TaxID=1314779 RepID=A0A6A6DQ70_9PEZI|nr:hypothetical protein K469DRAFT_752972 [Zopfia rhizophila CBS 207.26]
MFGFNQRGFSFEVQDECLKKSTPVQCKATFTASGVVESIGNSTREDLFQPNANVAGIGIFVSLAIQAFGTLLLACLFKCFEQKKEIEKTQRFRRYEILFALSDASLILTLAYILNFGLSGKCDMSTYHYYVALDSVLLACSTMVVTFTISRFCYFRTFTGVMRFIFMLAIFTLLAVFLGYQMQKNFNTDFPNWVPPKTNDSTFLLPISCFVDPDLIEYENPYSPNRNFDLDRAQLDRLGQPVRGRELPQLLIYIFLAVSFLLGWFAHGYGSCCDRQRNRRDTLIHNPHTQAPKRQEKRIQRASLCMGLIYIWVFAVCTATNIFCTWHISGLRNWARRSGWMGDRSEDIPYSIGQIMPLIALGGFVVVSFSQLWQHGRRR